MHSALPPLQFDLIGSRARLQPILQARLDRQPDPTICHRDDETFCCAHPIKFYLLPRSIITETSIAQLRKYATITAYANTSCVDYEIQQACHNIGLLFDYKDFLLWKELLPLGRIDNALWLEHATTEHTLSAHPSFQGTDLNRIEYAAH